MKTLFTDKYDLMAGTAEISGGYKPSAVLILLCFL